MVVTALVLATGTGWAQNVPPAAEPGRLEERFQPAPVPRAEPGAIITEEQAGQEAPEGAEGITFTLQSITLEGVTAYADGAFADLWAGKTGGTVSLKDIYDIANAITARYRNDGYVLSQAVVPAQTVADGTVRLLVVEGWVDQVTVSGSDDPRILAMARKIEGERPLTNATLEGALLKIGDLPGIDAGGDFQPSPVNQGASRLTVTVEEDPWDASVKVDNRGTRFSGPVQLTLSGGVNDQLGFGERIAAQYATVAESDELQFGSVSWTQPVGTEGTSVNAGLSVSRGEPGSTLQPFGIDNESESVTLGVSHPLLRSRAKNLSVSGTFDVKNSRSTAPGVTLSKDKLRVARIGVNGDITDALLPGLPAVSLLQLELSQGLDAFGARDRGDPLLSRFDAEADFTKLTFYASRTQYLPWDLTALLTANGQWSQDGLASGEEFGVGGSQFGRAYDSSEITGDSGVAAGLELDWNPPVELEAHSMSGWQIYGFYDVGAVWNRNVPPALQSRASLASAGVGSRIQLFETLDLGIELAVPLTRPVNGRGTDGDEARLFFTASASF